MRQNHVLLSLGITMLGMLVGCSQSTPLISSPTRVLAPTLAIPPTEATLVPAPTSATTEPAEATALPVATILPEPPTIELLTPIPPAPAITWTRQQFGDAWNIEYPQGWNVNDAGSYEGAITMEGAYGQHRYQLTFSVPILLVGTLDDWVAEDLNGLSSAQRAPILIEDTTAAGVSAKLVQFMPDVADGVLTHRLYIWRTTTINPRLIVIAPVPPDTGDTTEMLWLLEEIAARIPIEP
jgi:hypothetical protein